MEGAMLSRKRSTRYFPSTSSSAAKGRAYKQWSGTTSNASSSDSKDVKGSMRSSWQICSMVEGCEGAVLAGSAVATSTASDLASSSIIMGSTSLVRSLISCCSSNSCHCFISTLDPAILRAVRGAAPMDRRHSLDGRAVRLQQYRDEAVLSQLGVHQHGQPTLNRKLPHLLNSQRIAAARMRYECLRGQSLLREQQLEGTRACALAQLEPFGCVEVWLMGKGQKQPSRSDDCLVLISKADPL
eukprot:4984415-Prymnesium_polylepis.1